MSPRPALFLAALACSSVSRGLPRDDAGNAQTTPDAPVEAFFARVSDARVPDVGGRSDAASGEGGMAACMAGDHCVGNVACERACGTGGRVACRCFQQRFVCTSCTAADAGVDGREIPPCPGGAAASGRRCDDRGAACDYATDAGAQRLCVCAEIGRDRVWVCQ